MFETCSNAVKTAHLGSDTACMVCLSAVGVRNNPRLDEMSKLVAVLHPKPGDEILTTESLDESVVSSCPRGSWNVRGRC